MQLIYKQPRQDLDLCGYSFARYLVKMFHQNLQSFVWRDAMMVSIYQTPGEWVRLHVHCSVHPDMNEALKPTGSQLPEVIPGFCIMKRLRVFLLSLDGMLVHRISTPAGRDFIPPQFVRFPQQFAGTHLYSWVERDTVRVSCPGTQHSVPYQGSNPDRSLRGRAH